MSSSILYETLLCITISLGDGMRWGGGWVGPPLLTSGTHNWRPGQTCSLVIPTPHPQLVLTYSGGHRKTSGWQAGGTHPSGMLSFELCLRPKLNDRVLTERRVEVVPCAH